MDVSAPASWTAPSDAPAEPVEPWLADFGDQVLVALVDEALGRNFDLRAAAARVAAARARARIERADLFPSVEADLSAARRRSSTTGTSGTTANSFDLGGELRWELDLWGRLGNAARAAVLEAEGERADYHAARLSLAANVARAWFETIEADQQVRLAEKTVESFENSRETIEQQYRSGIGNALDVRLARENVATARSRFSNRLQELDGARRSLEVLLGRYPGAAVEVRRDLPAVKREVPVGLPSELLNRRPDLVAAERRLVATEHRVSEARANRLPSLRLTTSGGVASRELRDLLDWDALVWSLVGGLTQPIFEGGRLKAEEALSRAENHEAWAAYAQVALNAFREVETALAAESRLAEQEEALREAAMELREASVLALDRYRQGLSDIVTLLDTQRRAFNADSALLLTKRQRLQTRIDLYLALGGDFGSERGNGQDDLARWNAIKGTER